MLGERRQSADHLQESVNSTASSERSQGSLAESEGIVQDLVDEMDLALVNALQVRPRASWALLGRVLQVDAVTVARRWQRLSAAGLAWVTCQPPAGSRGHNAYLEVQAPSARLGEVAAELARDRHIYSIHHTTGIRPLLLGVSISMPSALSRYLMDQFAAFHDATVANVHLVTASYSFANRWRLRSLTPTQRRELEDGEPPPRASTPSWELTRADRDLIDALARDGRLSYTDLAAQTSLSEPTVRRRVNRLLASGRVELRCELAQVASGWPETAVLWIVAPADRLRQMARSMVGIPEIRAVVSVAGPANLLVFTWLRNVADLPRLEELLTRRCPGVTITDRAFCLHTMKLAGRLLDGNGRSTGHVPLDFWDFSPGTEPASTLDGDDLMTVRRNPAD